MNLKEEVVFGVDLEGECSVAWITRDFVGIVGFTVVVVGRCFHGLVATDAIATAGRRRRRITCGSG